MLPPPAASPRSDATAARLQSQGLGSRCERAPWHIASSKSGPTYGSGRGACLQHAEQLLSLTLCTIDQLLRTLLLLRELHRCQRRGLPCLLLVACDGPRVRRTPKRIPRLDEDTAGSRADSGWAFGGAPLVKAASTDFSMSFLSRSDLTAALAPFVPFDCLASRSSTFATCGKCRHYVSEHHVSEPRFKRREQRSEKQLTAGNLTKKLRDSSLHK